MKAKRKTTKTEDSPCEHDFAGGFIDGIGYSGPIKTCRKCGFDVKPGGAEPIRSDQFQCPRCAKHGCPSTGTRRRKEGVYRYRKCANCGWVFTTYQPHLPDGLRERIW